MVLTPSASVAMTSARMVCDLEAGIIAEPPSIAFSERRIIIFS
jgi:hypothetical protein